MGDIHQLNDLLARAHREAGELLLYIALVPGGLDGVPPPNVRAAMVAGLRDALFTVCESVDMIMLSPGLAGSMQRTVVRAMGVVSGMGRKFFIHESIARALSRLRTHVQDHHMLARLQRELSAWSTLAVQVTP